MGEDGSSPLLAAIPNELQVPTTLFQIIARAVFGSPPDPKHPPSVLPEWDTQVVSFALLMEPSYLRFQGSEGSKLDFQYLFLSVILLGIYIIRSGAERSADRAASSHQRRDVEPTPPTQAGSSFIPPSCWRPLPGLTSPSLVVRLSIAFTCGFVPLVFVHPPSQPK